MTESILFFVHYGLLLLFGIVLSFAFCSLRFTKKNIACMLLLFTFCGVLQFIIFNFLGEEKTWQLYPLIVHLPLTAILCLAFKRKITTAIASVSLAYLCCQPSKWIGLFFETFIHNSVLVLLIKNFIVLIALAVCVCYLASYISEIFSKDNRSVLIFSSVPLVYYLFDYTVGVYTNLWESHYQLAAEFLPFFLCIVYVVFCVIYYKEYEKEADAQRKERIIEITVQQQAKEIDAIKKSNLETRLLRHDMRLFLSNLALSIEQSDKENALKMISGFTKQVEAASVKRYCENDTINYILANFESRCEKSKVTFEADIELENLSVDEVLFSSIISNALDNALNAQSELFRKERMIKLMLKNSDGKLLLSVKNPYSKPPMFIDGLPISDKRDHGYGTQSIRYMTERLGGKCQFTLQNDMFVLRVVL